ncbi:putative mitochondrial phosphate carrier protein [Phaeoacremonium minimum UCRPA7]|uniref:Putative mitochondrial phosphate carrier protein n=1 Tax=Phaeoacremonium minimum (strain UCR-PA7) TaxID=1286976 RepID=R8BD28_PHAM7|nr:putative mitochondrial phosphate carrier protein [Phaeoacremonium minimum UCRPA7]EON97192.1 putative mitochondrial phosphate carrier protein [Phaeoacremonium minimum UCRPA7]
MPLITRLVSLTNFVVASSALGFQVFVLYPWHKELDAGFEELKHEHMRVLDAFNARLAAEHAPAEQRKGVMDMITRLGAWR